MACDGAFAYRWEDVYRWRGEEEDIAIFVALELFSDVGGDLRVCLFGEAVDFDRTGAVVAGHGCGAAGAVL